MTFLDLYPSQPFNSTVDMIGTQELCINQLAKKIVFVGINLLFD